MPDEVFTREYQPPTTDGSGNIHEMTLEVVRSLDAGARQFAPKFAGVTIPTLAEVLDLTRGKVLLQIEIKQTVLFESGKAIIKAESFPLLDQVALQILSHKNIAMVRIEGHTDSLGPEEDNLYLSQDRADAVRRYLVKRGVPKNKLQATGYGETRPLSSNDTAAGRTRNRRVEFFLDIMGE